MDEQAAGDWGAVSGKPKGPDRQRNFDDSLNAQMFQEYVGATLQPRTVYTVPPTDTEEGADVFPRVFEVLKVTTAQAKPKLVPSAHAREHSTAGSFSVLVQNLMRWKYGDFEDGQVTVCADGDPSWETIWDLGTPRGLLHGMFTWTSSLSDYQGCFDYEFIPKQKRKRGNAINL